MLKLLALFEQCFPVEEWKNTCNQHPLLKKVYPSFDIQALCFPKLPPRANCWQEYIGSMPLSVDNIIHHKPLTLTGLLLVFPENQLTPQEVQTFIPKLLSHPQANQFKLVRLVTNSGVLLSNFFGEQVQVIMDLTGQERPLKVHGGLFGTDPGEVNMNLFETQTSMGGHAEEVLDQLLKEDWTLREQLSPSGIACCAKDIEE